MGTQRPPHRRARTSGAGLARTADHHTPGSTQSARSAEARSLSGAERLEAMAAESGLPVEELLREVADLRLALATDLTIAAAAAEAGATDIAGAVLDGDRAAVAGFRDRVSDLFAAHPAVPLERATTDPSAPVTRRRLLRPTPLIAVAASLVFLLGGIVAGPRFNPPGRAPNQLTLDAQARYRDFSRVVGSAATAAQVIAASTKLHDSLASLVSSDPTTVVNLLNSEQLLLLSNEPAGTDVILAEVQALVRRLRATIPAGAAAVLDTVVIAPTPTPSPRPVPTAKPTGSPRPTAKPPTKPSVTPSAKPHPSGSPSASPTPTPLLIPPNAP